MDRIICALLAMLALHTSAFAQDRGALVLAASSLQEAISATADRWAAKGHARPVISFAASSALARQVLAGAPADLFVSADQEWMDALAAKSLIRAQSRVVIARNALVLVAPANSRTRLAVGRNFPLARALGPQGRLAMADPDSVPAGRYGKAALTSLNVWQAVAPRVVRAENVRAALAFVARGEAPLGIVYFTDAKAEPGVRIVGMFPASSHAPIVYPAAVLKSSANADAEGFRRFLLSREGQAIITRFGFGPGGR